MLSLSVSTHGIYDNISPGNTKSPSFKSVIALFTKQKLKYFSCELHKASARSFFYTGSEDRKTKAVGGVEEQDSKSQRHAG